MKDVPPHKMLLIDDEPGVLSMLKTILVRQGIDVHTADCGEIGIQKIQCHPYDIVITDLKMPGISGNEVLKQVRQIKGDALPVVAMSGTPWRTGESDFDGILTKPFSRKSLLDIIKALVPSFQD